MVCVCVHVWVLFASVLHTYSYMCRWQRRSSALYHPVSYSLKTAAHSLWTRLLAHQSLSCICPTELRFQMYMATPRFYVDCGLEFGFSMFAQQTLSPNEYLHSQPFFSCFLFLKYVLNTNIMISLAPSFSLF